MHTHHQRCLNIRKHKVPPSQKKNKTTKHTHTHTTHTHTTTAITATSITTSTNKESSKTKKRIIFMRHIGCSFYLCNEYRLIILPSIVFVQNNPFSFEKGIYLKRMCVLFCNILLKRYFLNLLCVLMCLKEIDCQLLFIYHFCHCEFHRKRIIKTMELIALD